MRTVIIDRELQPYIAVSEGKTHNGTRVVVLDTVVEEDLKEYNKGSVKWLVDRLDITKLSYYFTKCTELTEITLSEELPILSEAGQMFRDCINLREVTLPKELPVLSNAWGMFRSCTGLTKVTLPKELPILNNAWGMFRACISLTEITLPKELPMLSNVKNMFNGCTSLRKVTMSEKVYHKFHKEMFEGLDENKIEFIFY